MAPITHISLDLSLTPQKSHPYFSMLSVAGSLTIVLIFSYPSSLASGSFVSFPADESNWVSKEEGNFSSSCPTIWVRCLLRWVLPTLQASRRPSVAVLPSKGKAWAFRSYKMSFSHEMKMKTKHLTIESKLRYIQRLCH